jgi:hypothetical protein
MWRKTFAAVVIAALALTARAEAGDVHSGVLVPGVETPAPGKIFVSHDEFVFTDLAFASSPDAKRLALNVAAWFTGGRPGRFLAYSTNWGLTEPALAAAMTAAGHRWTVSTSVEFTLDTLLQYDAVFLAGTAVDLEVLTDYVRSGGNVLLEGGTGWGNSVAEAERWNPFLHQFGLHFEPVYDTSRNAGVHPISSASPLFKGVTSLYEHHGNPITKIDPTESGAKIIVSSSRAGWGRYAIYAEPVIPVAVEICPGTLNRHAASHVTVSVAGTSDLDVRRIEPGSLRVLELAARKEALTYAHGAPRGRRLGKQTPFGCHGGSDKILDLTLTYESRALVAAAERLLETPLEQGDVIVLTLTGRLRPQFGGTPILGEALAVVTGHQHPDRHPWHPGWGPAWQR